jgi:serine/threonine protein kinase
MEIFENKTLGHYTTLEYLGCGSFSAVYTAVHNFTKERVALKIAHTNDKSLIEEFNKIVKSGLKGLLKMDHKDIIGIRDYFMISQDGTDYFVMVLDLVKGQSLDRTNVFESLSVDEKLKMFVRICEAISYAHNFEYTDQNDYQSFRLKGIFHGDIKPNNILITPENEPKIIDFSFLNLKRALDDNDTRFGNKEVNTGAFGTPGYMAPEQEASGVVNEKTDVYSLAVVLKQLIYGLKYDRQSDGSPIYAEINAVIEKAMQFNPTDRYTSVHAMIKDIEKLMHRTSKMNKWMPYAAAAVVLVCIAGYFLFTNDSASEYNQSESVQQADKNLHHGFQTAVLSSDALRGVKTGDEANVEVDISKNKYYALLIGNNDYKYWKKLQYPVTDIQNMRQTLSDNYTFEKENIRIVENGSYEQIYKAFESFTDSGPNTYLLIYYAGHGKYDQVTEKAALIPVDAEEHSDSKNITSDIIKDLLKKCKIHNILFISDACYLGAMASRGETKEETDKPDLSSFKSFVSKQSRKFISSGARETVPDKSYFNEYLIKYLKNNPHDITFEYTLYNDIIEPIQHNSQTTPVYGVFFDTKDEGGHFFFMKRKK